MRVLAVDDDPVVLDVIRSLMRLEDNDCTCVGTAEEGFELASGKQGSFDLVLLDVDLPDRDGWRLLAELRAQGVDTPVIFLTGADALEERVKGLRLGADDYVIKPFEADELLARMQAVVRRSQRMDRLEYGGLTLDLSRREARHSGRPLHLSPGEFDLLRVLLEAGGDVVSRKELLRRVWGMEFDPQTKVVEVQIARLRRKLEPAGPPCIETVVGSGYRLSPAP